MKKNFGFVWLLLLVLCLTFCSCDASKISPWGEKNTQNTTKDPENDGKNRGDGAGTYKIYVCGAVAKEGYYEVAAGDTYLDAITQAGLLPESWIPESFATVVNGSTSFVVVNYVENDEVKYCINANHEFIAKRYSIADLPEEVVNKLADYIAANGAITNKDVLRSVLGKHDYQNYHYKFYVAEADYEEVD